MYNPMEARKKMLHEVIGIARKARAKRLADKFTKPAAPSMAEGSAPGDLEEETNVPDERERSGLLAAGGPEGSPEDEGFPAAKKLAALLKHLGG
jgi:hypothetical protein